MGLRSTFRPRFGPFAVNTGTKGVTSVSMRVLGVTVRLWDRRGRRGVSSIDLPGPVSYRPSLADSPGPQANPAPWGMNPRHRS